MYFWNLHKHILQKPDSEYLKPGPFFSRKICHNIMNESPLLSIFLRGKIFSAVAFSQVECGCFVGYMVQPTCMIGHPRPYRPDYMHEHSVKVCAPLIFKGEPFQFLKAFKGWRPSNISCLISSGLFVSRKGAWTGVWGLSRNPITFSGVLLAERGIHCLGLCLRYIGLSILP